MPKKRTKKRGTVSRKPAKRVASKSEVTPVKGARGLRIALINLVLFAIIFVVSIALSLLISDVILNEFFYMMALLTGAIAVAFLIVTLVFLFMRMVRRGR